jgi:FAD/FMN-containing dehydrogenase
MKSTNKQQRKGGCDVAVVNWMKNFESHPAVFVEGSSVTDVQEIVKNVSKYPSSLRPCGAVLSPTAIHSNDGGTSVGLTKLNTIHGLQTVPVKSGEVVTVIDTECGVTLRELEKYAHKNGMELPFSAEIGISTIGGTAFTTTKDSAIGDSPVPGMGIGDVASCLFAVTMVKDDGELEEYCVVDKTTGAFDSFFQVLLDSIGTQGIVVRMLVTVRPKTPVTTTLHVFPHKQGH